MSLFTLDYIPDPSKGRPLWDAKIYIGVPNEDPTIPSNQISLTGDIGFPLGGVISLAQPVRTNNGGVTVYNNSPVIVDTPTTSYAVAIYDRLDNLIYNFPNVSGQVTFETVSIQTDTVEAMRALDLQSGQIVETKSYWGLSATDTSGAARYRVVTAAEYGGVADDLRDIILENGNVATLILGIAIDPRTMGMIGNGVDNDTDVIALINADISHAIIDLKGLTPLALSKLSFTGSNSWRNGTIVYGGPSTDKLCEYVGKSTFSNVEFNGGGRQVSGGLAFVADDADVEFFTCAWKDVTGTLQGATNVLRNNQSGLIVTPNGANVTMVDATFENISNDNSGTYDTETIGYGFCSGILFSPESIVTPGDNTANPTRLNAWGTKFKNIQTVLRAGLSDIEQLQYNDADGIRALGDEL